LLDAIALTINLDKEKRSRKKLRCESTIAIVSGGAIVGALTGLAIPEEDTKAYDERISPREYLVILEGTQAEIEQAGYILRNRGIHEWKVYNAAEGYDSKSGVSSTTVNRDTQKYVDRTITDRDVIDTTTGDPEVEIVDRREEIR